LARLLEAGVSHLGRACVAHLAQCRAAAVQAWELAAFAAARPAKGLDRPDEEDPSRAQPRPTPVTHEERENDPPPF
jgi:hypothetical protein